MPDKQHIATYAAGAGLAAITLVYVFGPTFFIDGDLANTSASSRKKTIVGLSNPANDCFINSVLQALAGLGDLRIYLIQETHRRKLDGKDVYAEAVPDPARELPQWKLQGLQNGIVSQGLKDVLDALNERPIYKKTISAVPFVQVLETAFKQRISRTQQDAQEFLQVVAERLCDEYHAGHRARNHARKTMASLEVREDIEGKEPEEAEVGAQENGHAVKPSIVIPEMEQPPISENGETLKTLTEDDEEEKRRILEMEDGFPLEGGSESQIECLSCGFKPKPSTTTFCSLSLSVPQVSSTTLSSCFDQMFKTEYIEDFKCDKCRLVHALETFQHEVTTSNSETLKEKKMLEIAKLEDAIATNPEAELKDVELPDTKFAPKRKIAKHVRITKFPKIMAIHLSRSIFDARTTMKNSAKVAFPERLPLGGLLNQRFYKLSSVTCHKGSHHSGHYETFRRQNVNAPFATPNTFQVSNIYSKTGTPVPSQISTPQTMPLTHLSDANGDASTLSSTPELLSPASASAASSSPSLPYTNSPTEPSAKAPTTLWFCGQSNTTAAKETSGPTSSPRDPTTEHDSTDSSSIRSIAKSARESIKSSLKISKSMKRKDSSDTHTRMSTTFGAADVVRGKRKAKQSNRWWRISDDKVKESKTSEVLGMQREVYLLFYELEPEE